VSGVYKESVVTRSVVTVTRSAVTVFYTF